VVEEFLQPSEGWAEGVMEGVGLFELVIEGVILFELVTDGELLTLLVALGVVEGVSLAVSDGVGV
jgi:hypothetical protein